LSAGRIIQIKTTFERQMNSSTEISNSFSKQIIGDNVTIEIGAFEGKYAIAIEGDFNAIDLSSTAMIFVSRIEDKSKQGLIFKLFNEDLLEIFINFAYDLEQLVVKDKTVSVNEVYNRYLYWQKMFKKVNENISEAKVKGLLNELYLLNEYFITEFGVSSSVNAWIGSEKAHKDFAFSNGEWFEAKAIDVGKDKVEISSVEQLDSNKTGYLVITELEKTSSENFEGKNIFSIVKNLKEKIENENVLVDLYNKIVQVGIDITSTTDEYHPVNDYRYLFHNVKFYKVDGKFPVIRKNDLPIPISSVKYSLLVAELKEFENEFKAIGDDENNGIE
jgi:hypothetical protein